jgi:hypothetical protein
MTKVPPTARDVRSSGGRPNWSALTAAWGFTMAATAVLVVTGAPMAVVSLALSASVVAAALAWGNTPLLARRSAPPPQAAKVALAEDRLSPGSHRPPAASPGESEPESHEFRL